MLDRFLFRVTMYRLTLYYLVFLIIWSIIVNPDRLNISLQTVFLLIACYLFNKIFARIFNAPQNLESFAITALILSLIIGPVPLIPNFQFLILVSALATASKYLLVIHHRHLFNPAVVAVILANAGASWWVGDSAMLIPTTIGGLLILRKIRRFTLALAFLITYFIFTLQSLGGVGPLLFFVFVMLPEPQTSPTITRHQIIYAAAAALLFRFLPVSFSLELALILGNFLAYLLEPTGRFHLTLEHILPVSPTAKAFFFERDRPLKFTAGQYLELTLPHVHPDERGLRRFFTIASAPNEPEVMIVSKFAPTGSSFKSHLADLTIGSQVFANGPAGEFILPRATSHVPLAFVAGGIGITPFISIIKDLAAKNEIRDIVLLYLAGSAEEFIFKDVFKNTKTTYKVGPLETADITSLPDYSNRLFFVSGPPAMVDAAKKILHSLGISKIKTDYFPGY